MSSISAGTSSGTALVQTADTTGALVIKTGASATTAATFNADQSVTLAQPLPVVSGGTGATSLSGITVGIATSATTATNLAGGSNGTIPYQSAAGTTQMLAAGTSGYLLQSNGAAAPSWTPAPASAGSVTAVASGSLSNGSMVILNSDGTVSVSVASVATSGTAVIGLTVAASVTSYTQYCNVTSSYDPTTNTLVVYYIRNSDGYLFGVAGIISGSTITFGTTTALISRSVTDNTQLGFGAVFAPNVSRHVFSYNDNPTGYQNIKSLSVSGTSITVTSAEYYIFTTQTRSVRFLYDSTSGNVITVGANINYGYVRCIVFTVGATDFTLGSETNAFLISGSGLGCPTAIVKDTVNNKIVIAGQNDSGYPTAIVGTVSGTSISFGSPAQIKTSSGSSYIDRGIGLAYSPVAQKVMACIATDSSGQIQLAVGTVSGTSISFGTAADTGAARGSYYGYSGIYNTAANNIIFMVGTLAIIVTSISGTTFTVSLSSPMGTTLNSYGALSIYLSNSFLIITTGGNASNSTYPTVTGFTAYSSTLTSNNFLGVSSSAYTNGQTATIQTVGSTNSSQSGLTAGLKYYVAPDGTLITNATSQPYAGLALSATKLVIKG